MYLRQLWSKAKQEIYTRKLYYSFRMQYLDTYEQRKLTDITINTTLGRTVTTRQQS